MMTDAYETIKAALTKEYGAEKGKEVLYAGKNKGTFTGIDALADAINGVCDQVIKLNARIDAYCSRQDDHRVLGGIGFRSPR